MCGYSMADVLNVVVKANPSYSTYFQITSYSITPRTDVAGSLITMRLFLHLTGVLSDDPGVPSAERWFKGTIGGQTFAHMWKASGTYMPVGDYNFDISFYCSYIAGVVGVSLYCCNGNGSTGTASTPVWPAGYTMNATGATVPNVPGILRFNNIADGQWVGNYAAGIFSWADAGGATGGTRSYNLYYAIGGGFVYWGNTTGTSVAVDPAGFKNVRGEYVSFSVSAVGLYGASNIQGASYPTIFLAYLPTAPTSLSIAPNPGKYKGTLTLSWPAAVANSGSIDQYHIYVRHLPKGGAWTDWAFVGAVGAVTSTETIPYNYSPAYKAAPGSTYQFRIYARNTFGLWSTYRDSVTVLLKGGIMYQKVSGVWKEGISSQKVSGVWKEATAIYEKVAGVWKESI